MYCLLRITKRPIATLPASSIARASSTYGLGVVVGRDVVGGVEVDRVDLVEVDELLEVDASWWPTG